MAGGRLQRSSLEVTKGGGVMITVRAIDRDPVMSIDTTFNSSRQETTHIVNLATVQGCPCDTCPKRANCRAECTTFSSYVARGADENGVIKPAQARSDKKGR